MTTHPAYIQEGRMYASGTAKSCCLPLWCPSTLVWVCHIGRSVRSQPAGRWHSSPCAGSRSFSCQRSERGRRPEIPADKPNRGRREKPCRSIGVVAPDPQCVRVSGFRMAGRVRARCLLQGPPLTLPGALAFESRPPCLGAKQGRRCVACRSPGKGLRLPGRLGRRFGASTPHLLDAF